MVVVTVDEAHADMEFDAVGVMDSVSVALLDDVPVELNEGEIELVSVGVSVPVPQAETDPRADAVVLMVTVTVDVPEPT